MTTATIDDLSALASFGLIFGIACMIIGIKIGKYLGWERGWHAGQNHEASHTNARMIRAKMVAWRGGVAFGVEHHSGLLANRLVAANNSKLFRTLP